MIGSGPAPAPSNHPVRIATDGARLREAKDANPRARVFGEPLAPVDLGVSEKTKAGINLQNGQLTPTDT